MKIRDLPKVIDTKNHSYSLIPGLLASMMLFLYDMIPITKPFWLAVSTHIIYVYIYVYSHAHYQAEKF